MTNIDQNISESNSLPKATQPSENTLGKLLLAVGKIKLTDIELIQQCQAQLGLRFGEAAIKLGFVSEEDILQMLSVQFDYPYLQQGEVGCSAEMVAAFAPFSPQVEALRTLRSELLLRWFNGDNKQLAILGLEHGGGCSYLGANLAIVFSQMGEKTLLIDANLRQPKLHQFFNISAGKGLSDLLVGRLEMDKTIHKIPDFIDLSVLPAGTVPPNPQELLAKASFKVLLRELAQEYDIILIDTPNAALYADMKHVVSETKGALLVARKHHTSFRSVQTLQQQLINANVQLIGTVLNEF